MNAFLVNIWAEEQQLYKTELLYLYLLKIYKVESRALVVSSIILAP